MAERGPLVAVLAAGKAERFGGGKLDAPCAGRPLGQWALDAIGAAGLGPGVIVIGEEAPQFAGASGWQTLVNPEAAQGLGTSVACAARHALGEGRDLLLVLADMPLVTPAHLLRLVESGGAAASLHGEERPGVPALVPQEHLPRLCDLAGDRGAGPLLDEMQGLHLVDAGDGELMDVDRPEHLAEAERHLLARLQD